MTDTKEGVIWRAAVFLVAEVADPGLAYMGIALASLPAFCFCTLVSEQPHLKRLNFVWQSQPIYFITTCVAGRRPLLANSAAHEILHEEWAGLLQWHGWAVGRFVIMPDHVHFFVIPEQTCPKPLKTVIGKWKEWTSKRILKVTGGDAPLWQPEFFDHLLRSGESRSEKWEYVRQNPVRAGLVTKADDWP